MPDFNEEVSLRRSQVVLWWTEVMDSDDPGKTSWEVLRELEVEVTNALEKNDLGQAERLTARAWYLHAEGDL